MDNSSGKSERHERRAGESKRQSKKTAIWICGLFAFACYVWFETYRVEWAAQAAVTKVVEQIAADKAEEKFLVSLVHEAHEVHYTRYYQAPSIGRGYGRTRSRINLPSVDEIGYMNAMLPALTKLAKSKGRKDLAEKIVTAHLIVAASVEGVQAPQIKKKKLLVKRRAPSQHREDSSATRPIAQVLPTTSEDIISVRVAAGLVELPPNSPNRPPRVGDRVNILFLDPPREEPGCYVMGDARLVNLSQSDNEGEFTASLEMDFNSNAGSQLFLKLREHVGEKKVCLVRTTSKRLPEHEGKYTRSYRNTGCECAKERRDNRKTVKTALSKLDSIESFSTPDIDDEIRPPKRELYDPRKSRFGVVSRSLK